MVLTANDQVKPPKFNVRCVKIRQINCICICKLVQHFASKLETISDSHILNTYEKYADYQ